MAVFHQRLAQAVPPLFRLADSQASLVDFGFEGCLEGFVRVVGAEEIGMAHEEALLVVVGIDEPAGDAVGAVTADLAGVGVEHVDAMNGDLRVVVSGQWRVDSDLVSALSI